MKIQARDKVLAWIFIVETLKNEVLLVGSMKKVSVRATHVTDKG